MGGVEGQDTDGVVLVPVDQRDDSRMYMVRLNSPSILRPTARFRKLALDSGLSFLNTLTFDTFVREAQNQFEQTSDDAIQPRQGLAPTPGAARAV